MRSVKALEMTLLNSNRLCFPHWMVCDGQSYTTLLPDLADHDLPGWNRLNLNAEYMDQTMMRNSGILENPDGSGRFNMQDFSTGICFLVPQSTGRTVSSKFTIH